MADAVKLISGLIVSGLGLTIFFWPRPHSSLASLTSLGFAAKKITALTITCTTLLS